MCKVLEMDFIIKNMETTVTNFQQKSQVNQFGHFTGSSGSSDYKKSYFEAYINI